MLNPVIKKLQEIRADHLNGCEHEVETKLNDLIDFLIEHPAHVVIEVKGGVAEVTKCPDHATYEIVDHDGDECELAGEDDDSCDLCGCKMKTVMVEGIGKQLNETLLCTNKTCANSREE